MQAVHFYGSSRRNQIKLFIGNTGENSYRTWRFLNQGEYEKSSNCIIFFKTGIFLLLLLIFWMSDLVIGCWDINLYYNHSSWSLYLQVCYYGQHYHCFAYSQDHDQWIMYDDKTVKVLLDLCLAIVLSAILSYNLFFD